MAIKGLQKIKEKAAEKSGFSGDGEGVFLQLKDGEKVKVRFLQELDDESPDLDERRGTVMVVEEHSSPKDFKRTAMCTADTEGRCWACEQTSNPEIGKKWRSKLRFYANVIVKTEKDGKTALDTPKVKLLKRGFSDKDIGNTLVGMAEEFSLSSVDMTLSRNGAKMNDTSYNIFPVAPKPLTKDEKAMELFDPKKFLKEIPYDQQAAFYAGEEEEGGNAGSWLDK